MNTTRMSASRIRKDVLERTRIDTRKNGKIPANVVLLYLSENPEMLPTPENYGNFLIEENIYGARLALWHTSAKLKRYTKLTKERKVPAISESTLVSLLKDSTQKKYMERNSPRFSASPLCGASLKGNDGAMYLSEKRGKACVWTSL